MMGMWVSNAPSKTDIIKLTRGRVAIIVDDTFQVIGVKESALYVKALLNLIEYPPESYARMVAIVSTGEGMSLREIGRHLWSDTIPMWNMAKEGFRQLYEQIPGRKPDLEELEVDRWEPEDVGEALQ